MLLQNHVVAFAAVTTNDFCFNKFNELKYIFIPDSYAVCFCILAKMNDTMQQRQAPLLVLVSKQYLCSAARENLA